MRTRILFILLSLSLAWAATVSVLYWKLKNNPRVVAVTMETGKDDIQNRQLGEMERLTFLRQFIERYFNHDSNNFWQSQTSLAFLMSPKASEARLREVSRLRDKIQKKNMSQSGQLKNLKQDETGAYLAQIHLNITDGTMKNELYITLRLNLEATDRTLENPWGLLVREMNFLSSAPQAFDFSSQIHGALQVPAIVTFPCAIENIENPAEDKLKIKITTLNVSELQITPVKELTEKVLLTGSCKDREFRLEFITDKSSRDLFVSVPFAAGLPRKKEKPPSGPRKKDIYEKTIENVLGIQIESEQ